MALGIGGFLRRRPSLRALVLAVGGTACVVTATLGAILYRSAEQRTDSNNTFVQQTEIIKNFHDAQTGALSESGALAAYVVLRDPQWLDAFAAAREKADNALVGLRLSVSPEDRPKVEELIREHDALANQEKLTLDGIEQNDVESTIAAAQDGDLIGKSTLFINAVTAGVIAAQADLVDAQRADRDTQAQSLRLSIGVIVTWGLIIVALMAATLIWLVRPLRKASAATQLIAAGELTTTVPISGPSELARLAVDVNQLTDALISRSRAVNSYLSVNLEARTQELRASQERFGVLVHHGSDLITVIEADGTITYQSPSVLRVLGFSEEYVVGRKLNDLVHPEDVPALIAFMTDVSLNHDEVTSVALRLRTVDGEWRDAELSGTDRRSDPAVRGIVLNIRDVTDRVALETQLRFHAFHDPLTGLANRVRFSDRLEHALQRRMEGDHVAVLSLNLEDFKSANESLGQDVGDAILVEIAGRLSHLIRPQDTAARLGGDEFAILLEELTDSAQAWDAAERILTAIAVPLRLDGIEIVIHATGGFVVATPEATDPAAVMRDADLAMYEARSSKAIHLAQFNLGMRQAAIDRLSLLRDLDRALERQELVLEYQPTVVLATNKLEGMEALLRWEHPTRGQVQPDSFISLAEESGAILEIGAFVLRTACQQASAWSKEFHDTALTMNVNVSVHQLLEPGFVALVKDILAETELDPRCLVLEITESVMMGNQTATKTALRQLKEVGIRLAIDDFGTGYSSLRYLREFPFDIIKIDKSFLADDHRTKSDRELEAAIVDLGRTLKLQIIAEGIETAEQLSRLKSLGCELGQGYYFARAMAPEAMEIMMRSGAESRIRYTAGPANGSSSTNGTSASNGASAARTKRRVS